MSFYNYYQFPGGTIFESCIKENLTNLQWTINEMTNLQNVYSQSVLKTGPLSIKACALDAQSKSNQKEEARKCIAEMLAYFYNFTARVEDVLLCTEEAIKQALAIIPTCAVRARRNATLSVNGIVQSISVCVENYKHKLDLRVEEVSFHCEFRAII